MSIASRIEQIEQHIENAYESIGNKGVDLRDKLNIDLKGNTSQEVVQGEVGLEEEDTSIYVDDVNEDKENYITLKGNTYQETTSVSDGDQYDSPSPDYPQEIEVVTGLNEVKVEGKNLFNKNSGIEYGKFYTNTGNVGTDNDTFIQTIYIPVNSSTQYTISGYYSDYFRICEYDKDKNFIQRNLSDNTTTSFTITTTAQTKYIRISCFNRNLSSIQIEQSSTATTYEAYKGASYPVNLGSIELCKIGTYQDRIYKSNIDNNWYKHSEIGKYTFTGNENVMNFGDSTYEFRITTNLSNIEDGTANIYCLCDKLVGSTGNSMWNKKNTAGYNLISAGPLSSNFLVILNDITTSSGISSALSTLKPVVYYVLTTATDTQITDATLVSQLEALYTASIHAITHINTETSNLLPYIDLKYNVVTASPSPERASEVEVVTGNNTIKIQSKNLFDIPLENGSSNGVTWTVNENGSITLNGTSTNHININSSSLNIPVTEGETYTISATNILAGNIGFKELNGTDIWVLSKYSLTKTKIITSDMQTTNVKFSIYIPPNNTFNNVTITFQLEKGNQATPYVPYQSQSYNITLGNLELCKIGDYQDYFYKENGNWYKYAMIGKVVLNGSESDWHTSSLSVTGYKSYYVGSSVPLTFVDSGKCNYFEFKSYNDWIGLLEATFIEIAYQSIGIRVVENLAPTLEDFKNWLSTHNTIVYYVLATPTATQITDTKLINQLNALADARKYEDGIETIINQTNSSLSFEIETNPTHLNRNIENISTEIDKIETTEWKPQPDWWDIKTIIKDDEENYPYKIIALQDEGAKTLNIEIDSLFAAKKVKLSDGQEITTSGLYTVNEEGLKNCSKGYKTFYSIWYFNDIPNFSYNSIGYFFRNSRYIYFYNIGNINLNSSFSWVSNQNRLLEAVESNKQIATGVSNETFRILQANCLRRIPDWVFRRSGNIHSPNTIGFSVAPYIKYKDMTKIINSRNFDFTSGVAPEIANSFLDETIDFENDWGMPTTLFTTTSSIIGPYAVQKMDFENVTSFKGTLNVSEVYEVYNIKLSNNYFTGEMLSHDTLVRVLNALYNYSGSEDTYTLTLGATNLAKLTNDEKAIATNKGWTLA